MSVLRESLSFGAKLAAVLAMGPFTGCAEQAFQAPEPEPALIGEEPVEVNPKREVDILFVVDNSQSMAGEQAELGSRFTTFTDALNGLDGGLPDVRIAVINTNTGAGPYVLPAQGCRRLGGDRGAFQTQEPVGGVESFPFRCGLWRDAKYISTLNKGALTNFSEELTLESTFRCLATGVGTDGCQFEQPLQAIRFALQEDYEARWLGGSFTAFNGNRGFLREDAFLGIFILSDEDDCSAPVDVSSDFFVKPMPNQDANLRCATDGHICDGVNLAEGGDVNVALSKCRANANPSGLIPVQTFVDFVKGLKDDPSLISVAAIAGVPQKPVPGVAPLDVSYRIGRQVVGGVETNNFDLKPICSTVQGNPAPALRIKAFADAFGESGQVESLCAPDLGDAIEAIAAKWAEKFNRKCLEAKLKDTDLAQPGVQMRCQVLERRITNEATGEFLESEVAQCGAPGSDRACWQMIPPDAEGADETCGDKFTIKVDRFGADGSPAEPPKEATEIYRCVICPEGDDSPGCSY